MNTPILDTVRASGTHQHSVSRPGPQPVLGRRQVAPVGRPAATGVQRQHAPAVLASQLQLPAARGCSAAAAPGGAHLLLEDPGAATVV